jgi:hypothetical protein
MVLTHKAIKVKMREQLGRVEKKAPISHFPNRWGLYTPRVKPMLTPRIY